MIEDRTSAPKADALPGCATPRPAENLSFQADCPLADDGLRGKLGQNAAGTGGRTPELFPNSAAGLLRELWEAEQEVMQQAMGLPGWRYKDLPKLSEEDFAKFVEIAGEGNLRWITRASYPCKDGGKLHRGQVMISPDGIERISQYARSSSPTPAARGR